MTIGEIHTSVMDAYPPRKRFDEPRLHSPSLKLPPLLRHFLPVVVSIVIETELLKRCARVEPLPRAGFLVGSVFFTLRLGGTFVAVLIFPFGALLDCRWFG